MYRCIKGFRRQAGTDVLGRWPVSASVRFWAGLAALCCSQLGAVQPVLEYDLRGSDNGLRGYDPVASHPQLQASAFKSSFTDRPQLESPDGVGFRGKVWGMVAVNTNRNAIDAKWYFEFTVTPQRWQRLTVSSIRFSAAIADASQAADRWFLTSSIDGHAIDRILASGTLSAASGALPSTDGDFSEVVIDLAALPQLGNLARPVTFRLYWTTQSGVGDAVQLNLTRIRDLQLRGSLLDARQLPPQIYRVADFGATGDGQTDDGPAIRAAFAAAAAQPNPATIVFAPGARYRFAPYATEYAQIQIRHTQDLRVEGNGATLIINPENRPLLIWRSRDVVVRGLDVDFDPLPFTQGEVLAVDPAAGQLVFQIQDGYPDVDPPALQAIRPDWDNAVFIEADTRRFTHNWVYPQSLQAVADHPGRYLVRVVSGQEDKLNAVQPGQIFVINRHESRLDGVEREKADELGYFYSIESFSVMVRHSHDVVFEDFNLYAFAGRAWNVFDSDRVELNRVRIMRKPGTDRAVSGVRGGIIMKELRGGPIIRNSHVEASMDDTMNRSDTPCFVEQVSGTQAVLRFSGNKWGDSIIAVGDNVEFWDRVNSRLLGTARVLETIRDNHRNHRMRFDRIPAGVISSESHSREQATLVYRVVDQPFVVQNTFFGTQLKKAIILRLPAEISDSYFEHANYGIHAYNRTTADEGPYPRNQILRNLTFYNVGIGAIVYFKPGPPSGVPHQNIRMENIRIHQDVRAVTPAHGINIVGINGATVRDAIIHFGSGVAAGQQLIRVDNSSNIELHDNVLLDERLPWTDSAGDGIPDWWKLAWFGTLQVAAGDDSDNDGATNLEEFLAGTHPRDPQSRFRAHWIRPEADGMNLLPDAAIGLRWNSAIGRRYQIHASTTLDGPQWITLQTITASPPENHIRIPLESVGEQLFLRVIAAPEQAD